MHIGKNTDQLLDAAHHQGQRKNHVTAAPIVKMKMNMNTNTNTKNANDSKKSAPKKPVAKEQETKFTTSAVISMKSQRTFPKMPSSLAPK